MDAQATITPSSTNPNDAACAVISAMAKEYRKARLLARNPSKELFYAVLNTLIILTPYVDIYPAKTSYNRRMCALYNAFNTLLAEIGKENKTRPKRKTAKPSVSELFEEPSEQARTIAANPPQGFKEAVQTAQAAMLPFADYFPYFSRQGEAMNEAINKLDRVAMDLGLPRAVGQ